MIVLAGPRLDLGPGAIAAGVCRRLAGPDGEVVSLARLGLADPYRNFSAAEVEGLRGVLRGESGVVGYVCVGARAAANASLVAVTDHVNLTWRTPLAGANDDQVGPRFPSMDGVYVPDAAEAAAHGEDGLAVIRGVVAGVADDRDPDAREAQEAERLGWVAVSSELVAPVIVAAHMGLRVAAFVVVPAAAGRHSSAAD